MRLKALDAEEVSLELDPDQELLLFDPALDVQKKMKKAFCEPGNDKHCPPLTVIEELVLGYGVEKKLLVPRKEENGGDLTYTDAASMRSSFASGELHPGDLKPAAKDAVEKVLQGVRDAIKGDAELVKAQKEVEKAAKKAATSKGKK